MHWLWMQSRSNCHDKMLLVQLWMDWTSTNKHAITLVIAYYLDRYWALHEVQPTFDEVDHPFISFFKCSLQMLGQGPTHCRKVSRTFERRAWLLWTYQLPFAWKYQANSSLNYLMTRELQSTLEASAIEWPALRNPILGLPHVIERAVGASRSSQGVKGCTGSWEAHERAQEFGDNESINIGKSQRLPKEGNARMNKVSAMRRGLAKTIDKVRISTHIESPETDFHIAVNVCCIAYGDTWLSKRVHWLSNSLSPHRSATYCWCEDTLELDTGVAWVTLPIARIIQGVAPESRLQWAPATLHKTGWMDHCYGRHGSFEAIPSLDPAVVEEVYSHIASCYQNVHWNVRSYGWQYASFG